MARRPRAPQIETRTSRLKLAVRRKPYAFTVISPGIALGYRRNHAAGVWVVRVADGAGGNWTKRVGLADDFEAADGEHVLTFWEAQDRARKLARGSDADSGRPASVADAVEAYARDLAARGGDRENAGRIRKHLTPTLVSKPVGLLTARELAAWRDRLLADGVKSATVVRLMKSAKAALNLSARRDPRIQNTAAWRDGLGGIAEDFASRNVQRLDDDQANAVIAAAYAIDPAFGLYVETAAVTGARLSQIARLTVADLQGADNGAPRLLMPASRKGRSRKLARRPVPITHELAAKLASNRAPGAPLLLRADGLPWQSGNDGDHSRLYAEAAARAGVSGSIYALRHSSIVRALLANVPVRVVAATHDTSVVMIERTYASYIADFADEIARRGLLVPTARPATKRVVPLAGRKL
jgi:integrase